MKIRSLLITAACATLCATSTQGALKKYEVRSVGIQEFEDTSPQINIQPGQGIGTAVVDNDGGSGNPLLKKLALIGAGAGQTVDLPGLSGFIYLKTRSKSGPAPNQTGTGDVSSAIDWGIVTGWTITGGSFCNSVPATICDRAMIQDDETVPPALISNRFDLHEWTFHGTGFTSIPFLSFTSNNGVTFGNTQTWLRGPLSQDGTVPALPLLGIAIVGMSVVTLGIAAVRRLRS